MSGLDPELLTERAATVEGHLARVAARLPPAPEDLRLDTDASDAVVLHLFQAVQVVMNLAVSACLRWKLGSPENYGDAFVRLAAAGQLGEALAGRLALAADYRDAVVHAYESLEMARVHQAAVACPADLRAFLRIVRDRLAREEW
jgi:uncharacterized protein YutE (UPF0331/DUF86 family)